MKTLSVFILSGLFLLAVSHVCLAAATGVSIKMQPAKITKHLSGDGYATNQPTIRVLSTGDNKYDALDTKNMEFSITTKASYTPNWIVVGHDVSFTGQGDSVNLNSVTKDGHYETKYIPPKYSMSPIEICNNEVKIRGAKSMADGFVMKIPDAYTVQYKAKFKRVVLQSTHSKSDSVNTTAWVICEKTKSAKKDVEKQVPFLKSFALNVSQENYKGTCPAEIKQVATFRVNGPGKINYAFLGEDGSKGPKGTLKFVKAGGKSATWNRKVEIPKPKPGNHGGMQLAAPDNTFNGTTTLEYSFSAGDDKFGVSPQPEKVSFTVLCEEPQKKPARMKKTTPDSMQMQLQGIEVKPIQ